MELFRNIRLNIGRSILSKRLASSKRTLNYSSFSIVKTIGIVWDATKTEDYTILSRFSQKMHERDIEVELFAYFPVKTIPDKFTAVKNLTILKRDNLNFFYMPVSNDAEIFINKVFDVLIDINFNQLFQLNCITSLSKSAFKVGLSDNKAPGSPFDLILGMNPTVDLNEYLVQVLLYLEMIKNGKPLTAK